MERARESEPQQQAESRAARALPSVCRRTQGAGALKAFASSDDLFRTAPLDAYSEAWALTYYLVETRRQQHADYLRQIAKRKQGSAYSESERLADFQNAFGKNLDLLEASFLRFINGL